MTQVQTGATTGEPVLGPAGPPVPTQVYVPNLETGGAGFAPVRGVGYFLDAAANPTGSAYAGLGLPLDPTTTLVPGTWVNGAANGVAVLTVPAPAAGLRLWLVGLLITFDSATSAQVVTINIGNLQASGGAGTLSVGFTPGAALSGFLAPPFPPIPANATALSLPVTANFAGAVPPYTGTTATGNGIVNLFVVTRQG